MSRLKIVSATLALAVGTVLVGATSAQAWAPDPHHGSHDSTLTPETHFTMQPDGSSGATVGGEHIPNIDIDKKTIATYYGDPGTGIANKTASPYITEMNGIVAHMTEQLPSLYAAAQASGKTPAIVLDTDDTMLWTYDREVSVMHFTFNPVQNNADVLNEVFPGTPAMVAFENAAIAQGFQVIGITGRSAAGGIHRQRHQGRLHRLHDRQLLHQVGAGRAAELHHLRGRDLHDRRVQGRHARVPRDGGRRQL